MDELFPYEDIVNLPPHKSSKYPQPTMAERAARFAPFAAITGYEEMVAEEARVTNDQIELDEVRVAEINEKLNILQTCDAETEVTITYFEHDKIKDGGEYRTVTVKTVRIDAYGRTVILPNSKAVCFDDIYEIESDVFAFEEL